MYQQLPGAVLKEDATYLMQMLNLLSIGKENEAEPEALPEDGW